MGGVGGWMEGGEGKDGVKEAKERTGKGGIGPGNNGGTGK